MVYALIIIGCCLILINMKAINKGNNTFKDTYVNAKDNITDFEVELGKLRNEFAETLIEIQGEIEDIKQRIDDIKSRDEIKDIDDNRNAYDIKKTHDIEETDEIQKIDENEVSSKNSNNIKIEQVNKMLGEGCSVEDIAEKLQLGKGEVLLIKELYLK